METKHYAIAGLLFFIFITIMISTTYRISISNAIMVEVFAAFIIISFALMWKHNQPRKMTPAEQAVYDIAKAEEKGRLAAREECRANRQWQRRKIEF